MSNDKGDWTVSIAKDNPDMVRLQLTEFDENGGVQHNAYLPPEIARDLAFALTETADWIDGD